MMSNKNLKRIAIAVVGIVVFFALVLLLRGGDASVPSVLYEDGQMRPYQSAEPSGEVIHGTYDCPDRQMFLTEYDIGSNELMLETDDGTQYTLLQSVSETGARYASADGSVVFYEADGYGMVEIDGTVLYEDCESLDW